MKFIDQVPRFAPKMRILVMTPSSAKPCLGFEFDFGLIVLELSLVEIGESINSTPHTHTLLEVCPAHKGKVEIKCMGSVGGKTPTKPKLYLFFSNFRHFEYDKVDIICFVHL